MKERQVKIVFFIPEIIDLLNLLEESDDINSQYLYEIVYHSCEMQDALCSCKGDN